MLFCMRCVVRSDSGEEGWLGGSGEGESNERERVLKEGGEGEGGEGE